MYETYFIFEEKYTHFDIFYLDLNADNNLSSAIIAMMMRMYNIQHSDAAQ